MNEAELIALIPQQAQCEVQNRFRSDIDMAAQSIIDVAKTTHPGIAEIQEKIYPDPLFRTIGGRRSAYMSRETFDAGPQPRIVKTSVWDRLKVEFYVFICTQEEKYSELRKKFRDHANEAGVVVVGLVAASLAPYVGVAAGVIVPLCALCLLALAVMGREACCAHFS